MRSFGKNLRCVRQIFRLLAFARAKHFQDGSVVIAPDKASNSHQFLTRNPDRDLVRFPCRGGYWDWRETENVKNNLGVFCSNRRADYELCADHNSTKLTNSCPFQILQINEAFGCRRRRGDDAGFAHQDQHLIERL